MSARAERYFAIAIAIVALVPLGLIVVEACAPGPLAQAIHGWLGPFCHQDPARSPIVRGHALGACYRCVGVDLGLTWTALPLALGRPISLRHAGALFAIGVLDWLLGQSGLGPDLAVERLAAGLALGAGLAMLAISAAGPLTRAIRRPRRAVRTFR